jgi:hypothetical protein
MESSWIRVILNRSVGVVTIPFGQYRSHLVRAGPVAIETKVINGAVQSSQRNAAKHKSADALKSLGRGPVGSVGPPGWSASIKQCPAT